MLVEVGSVQLVRKSSKVRPRVEERGREVEVQQRNKDVEVQKRGKGLEHEEGERFVGGAGMEASREEKAAEGGVGCSVTGRANVNGIYSVGKKEVETMEQPSETTKKYEEETGTSHVQEEDWYCVIQ